MINHLKKILYFSLFSALLSGQTFACINDEYTVRSEALWGASYENAFLVNMLTASVIALVILYVLYKTFMRYKKDVWFPDMLYAILMAFAGINISALNIFFDRVTIAYFFMPFFIGIYAVLYLRFSARLFLEEKRGKQGYSNVFFLLTGIYIVYLLSQILVAASGKHYSHSDFEIALLVLFSVGLPLFAYFKLGGYRFRVYSFIVFMLGLVVLLPSILKTRFL